MFTETRIMLALDQYEDDMEELQKNHKERIEEEAGKYYETTEDFMKAVFEDQAWYVQQADEIRNRFVKTIMEIMR